MTRSTRSMTPLVVWIGAGMFALAGAVAVHADETVVEKQTEESHSYKVEESVPAHVVTERTVTTTERVPPPAVVEKHTTVETIPAPPVVQRRTTETVHTEE